MPIGIYIRTEYHKKAISEGLEGRKRLPFSEDHRKSLSESHKGKKLSEKHKKRISESLKGIERQGHPAWNKGKKHTKATKKKMSKARIGRHFQLHSEEAKKKMSLAAVGNKNGYVHGQGYTPYLSEFIRIREQIRARDNWKCQECGVPQEELETTLHVHHIDLNKENSSCNNLITLCPKCHGQIHRKVR